MIKIHGTSPMTKSDAPSVFKNILLKLGIQKSHSRVLSQIKGVTHATGQVHDDGDARPGGRIPIVTELCAASRTDPHAIQDVVLGGNPAMLQMAAGINKAETATVA